MLTAYCCEGWNFRNHSKLGKDFGVGFSTDSVYLQSGYILLFDSYINKRVALGLEKKSINEFESFIDFNSFKSSNNISAKLLLTKDVYYSWKNSGQLPWAKEILSN